MFSSEICEIFKNTYFEEHLRTTTSIPTRPSSFISSTEKLEIVQELKTFQVGASLRMTAKCNNHMTKQSSFQLFITTLSNENIPEVLWFVHLLNINRHTNIQICFRPIQVEKLIQSLRKLSEWNYDVIIRIKLQLIYLLFQKNASLNKHN